MLTIKSIHKTLFWALIMLIALRLEADELAPGSERETESVPLSHKVVFNIPAQSMDSGLREYARHTRRQLFFLPSLTLGKRCQGLSGRYDPDLALDKLLAHSGLVAKRDIHNGITIVKKILSDLEFDPLVIEEIIVKAQKRFQDAQTVGLSISVFTTQNIAQLGLSDTAALGANATSVMTSNISGNTQPSIFIRGVGLNDTRINNTPPAGLYVDEVFMSSTALMGLQVFDVERVEILKGPQGTLYGRNTTAGTVSYFTQDPTRDFEAQLKLGAGSYRSRTREGLISGSLSSNLQMRFAFQDVEREGHQRNTFLNERHGGIDTQSARLSIAWQPMQSMSVNTKLFGSNNNSQGMNFDAIPTGKPEIIKGHGPSEVARLILSGQQNTVFDPETVTCEAAKLGNADLARQQCTDYLGQADTDGDPNLGRWNVRPVIDNETLGFSTSIDWTLGQLLFSSVTGVVKLSRERSEDRDGSPQRMLDSYYSNDLQQASQEFRLSSMDEDKLSWIVGVLYSNDQYDTTETFDFSDSLGPTVGSPDRFVPVTEYIQETDTAAVFTHLDYALVDHFRGVFGLRYTYEKKSFTGGSRVLLDVGSPFDGLAARQGLSAESSSNGILPLFGAGGCVYDGTQLCREVFSVSDVSGKVGFEYTGLDQQLVYGSFSKGFKSGGINGSIGLDPKVYEVVDEEIIWAYELGYKSDLLDKSLRFNAALFFYEYKGLQFKHNVSFNADSGLGFPYTELTNSGDAAVRGGEFEFWWRPVKALNIRLGVSMIDFDIKSNAPGLGRTQTHTPKASANVSIHYEIPLNSAATVALAMDASWQDEVFQDAQNSPILTQSAYALVNGRVSLSARNSAWNFALWGKNMADEQYSLFGFNLLGGSYSLAAEVPSIGRTYGVEASYRFR